MNITHIKIIEVERDPKIFAASEVSEIEAAWNAAEERRRKDFEDSAAIKLYITDDGQELFGWELSEDKA